MVMNGRLKRFLWSLALALLLAYWGLWRLGSTSSGGTACDRPRAVAPGCPTNLEQLLASAAAENSQYDIALVNLLCAEGLQGAENLNSRLCLATLDRWADRVRSETERHLYRYHANPREFESSEGYFRMLLMAVVLYGDFSVRYNPARIATPGSLEGNDHFFADSRDLFLHGLLGRAGVQSLESKVQGLNSPSPNPLPEERVTALRPAPSPQLSTLNRPLGTCSSMPVLYVAIGRRLGYPLKLATTKAHVFLRWEGASERFDLEATGKGMNRYDDEHFKQWPFPVTGEEIQADGYLNSLTPVEELALFLSLRGHCLQEAGRISEAVASYSEAARLAPNSRPYRLLLAAAQQGRTALGAATRVPSLPGPPQPSLNPQLTTLSQPPDPNPLLKIR